MFLGCSDDDDNTSAGPVGSWDWEAVGTGVNDRIFAFAEYSGDLYVGGYFDTAGGIQAVNFALWNDSSWEKPLSAEPNDEVAALVVYDGELAAGGSFSALGGFPVTHHFFWDGTTETSYAGGPNGRIYALCVYDSLLIVGGDFSEVSGGAVTANNIASYNGNTLQWQAMDNGTDGPVYALTVYDGKLYAGGHFVHAGGAITNNITVWHDSASSWGPLLTGVSHATDTAGSAVFALAEYKNRLYVGGQFTEAGSTSARYIASYALSGWQACGTGAIGSSGSHVRALTVFDNKLIAGGYFTSMGGVSNTAHIAAWDGSAWSALGNGIYGPYWPHVWALCVYNNMLYAGGRFTIAGTDSTCGNIARWGYTSD